MLNIFNTYKIPLLSNRYLSFKLLEEILEQLKESNIHTEIAGKSVNNNNIHLLKIGEGATKVLMWSQMHGNETTTTKAVLDLLVYFSKNPSSLFSSITIYVIPMLNPDGANLYTRLNANNIDLNRDAINLTQPESVVLNTLFNTIKPNFCFNLHGQRTIFGVGKTGKSSVASFLSPSQCKDLLVTKNRLQAMQTICYINDALSKYIKGKIGRYDDAFNINCVGDYFQSKGVPTILFEAGQDSNDYDRQDSRFYMFLSIYKALEYIDSNNLYSKYTKKDYLDIPENTKTFKDILINNVEIDNEIKSLVIQYKEILKGDRIIFKPILTDIISNSEENKKSYYHKVYNMENISLPPNFRLEIGEELEYIIVNNSQIKLVLE